MKVISKMAEQRPRSGHWAVACAEKLVVGGPPEPVVPGKLWLSLVADFGRLFRRSPGTPESLRRDAEKRGRKRAVGVRASARLFG